MFLIGAVGVTVRKNALTVLMCIELMLNAVNLMVLSFDAYNHLIEGNVLVIFIITVAAIEAAVGLALIVYVFRKKETIDINKLNTMSG